MFSPDLCVCVCVYVCGGGWDGEGGWSGGWRKRSVMMEAGHLRLPIVY